MILKIVIAGSRTFHDWEIAKQFIDESLEEMKKTNTLIFLSGTCAGTDQIGERYAKEYGFKVERYPADWKTYGKRAGPIRNKQMAEACDLVICFWDGKSKGTKSLIRYAKKYEKPVKIKLI